MMHREIRLAGWEGKKTKNERKINRKKKEQGKEIEGSKVGGRKPDLKEWHEGSEDKERGKETKENEG